MAFFKKFRDAQRPCCAALVAAAGSSSRMGGVNKLLQPLDGIPVLARTLTALQMARRIDEIVVAAREEDFLEISQLCRTYGITKCTKVIRGGESRAHSVLLAALEAGEGMELLAVQDGARPLVTPELIDDVAEQAARCGAAAPAVAVKDTIKAVRDDGTVAETLDRAALRAVQTPQIFESALLKAALQAAVEGGIPITDDCSAVERLGKRVYLVEGDEENLKITTPVDLILAEAILQAREIPTANSQTIGVRSVIQRPEAEALIAAIPSLAVEESSNWNKRYRENLLRMKSGDLYEVARVIKGLMFRERKRGLSNGERKMLHTARQILLSELVLAEDSGYEEVERRVEQAMLQTPEIQR